METSQKMAFALSRFLVRMPVNDGIRGCSLTGGSAYGVSYIRKFCLNKHGRVHPENFLGLHSLTGINPQPNIHIARNCRPTPSVNLLCRYQSDGNDPSQQRKVTPVFLAIPNPFKAIKNWMFGVIIRAYFDPEFTFREFTEGAKQGFSIISKEMASGNFDNLSSMVSPKVLPELRDIIGRMDVADRERLAIPVGDILHSTPQNAMVHYDDKGGRFLYILMKFWCLSSYAPKDESEGYGFKIGTPPPGVSQEEFDNMGSIISCTYEFLREVTPGVEPEWTVSHIQHGKQINTENRDYPPS